MTSRYKYYYYSNNIFFSSREKSQGKVRQQNNMCRRVGLLLKIFNLCMFAISLSEPNYIFLKLIIIVLMFKEFQSIMSQKPITGYTTMQEEHGAGGPPPYGPPQPGYPPQQHQPTFQTTNTTVVVNQPVPLIMQQGMRDWSSGLCGCFEDCYSCK